MKRNQVVLLTKIALKVIEYINEDYEVDIETLSTPQFFEIKAMIQRVERIKGLPCKTRN